MKQCIVIAIAAFGFLAACKSANINDARSEQTATSAIEKLNGIWQL